MHLLRGEVVGSVERELVVAVEIREPLETLAAQELTKKGGVKLRQVARCYIIEAFAKARVAGRAFDLVERPEVGPRRLILSVVIELQQRDVFQHEQGQPRHQVIHQRDVVDRRVGEAGKHLPRFAQQPLDAELFAGERLTYRYLLRNLRCARQYTESHSEVYEELFFELSQLVVP